MRNGMSQKVPVLSSPGLGGQERTRVSQLIRGGEKKKNYYEHLGDGKREVGDRLAEKRG